MIKKISCYVLNHKVSFTTLTAPIGSSLLKKVLKILSPVFKNPIQDLNYPLFFFTIISCLNVENDDEVSLMKELLQEVLIDDKFVDFETFFSGNIKLLLNIVFKVLYENYSGIFLKKRFTPADSGSNDHPISRKVEKESELDLNLWKPILDQTATLHEVSTFWSTEDLYDYLEAASIKHAYESHQMNNKG
jgi:hypothetical protein